MIETHPNPAECNDAPAPVSETREASGIDSGGRRSPVARLSALAVVTAMLGWAYAPNMYELSRTWTQDPNYSHGYLVIPIALVILWERLKGASSVRIAPWAGGWVALAAILAARAWYYEQGYEWQETATIVPVVGCLALTYGGWPLLGRIWPAIAFLVFMLPLPAQLNGMLALPLQRLATVGSCFLLQLSGLWVVAEGNVILVGANQLEVATACNGLSMLMCLAATITAMTVLVPMAWWKRIVLMASIVPIALFSNILRIAATAWCYHLFGYEVGSHMAHDAAGWLMMPLALILVGLQLGLLSWLVVEETPIDDVRQLRRLGWMAVDDPKSAPDVRRPRRPTS